MLKKYLLVFFISMVPLIELRGAVPVGLSNLWGDALPIIPLYIICIIGNMLPVPIIFFFARKVLVWGADKKIIGKLFRKRRKRRKEITRKSRKRIILGIVSFCRYTTSWNRSLDRNTCSKPFRYGF